MSHHKIDLEGPDFLKQIKDDNPRKYGKEKVTTCQVSYEDITDAGWEAYAGYRFRNLQGLITLFCACGLDLYAEDGRGLSAFEYAVDNGIDRCIPHLWRNMRRERRILARAVLAGMH